MIDIWTRIAAMLERHGRCALVTTAEQRGSGPREVGSHMAVAPDGTFSGTIGGGALEWRALAEAQALIGNGQRCMRFRDLALGPELGQCCGGRVRLLLELFDASDSGFVHDMAARGARTRVFSLTKPEGDTLVRSVLAADDPRAEQCRSALQVLGDGAVVARHGRVLMPLYLFGAGHVGRAIMLAMAPLSFRLIWVDTRADAFPDLVPGEVEMRLVADPREVCEEAPDDAFALVMTHSHALDLAICHKALQSGRFAYVGLIGSQTKKNRFLRQLADGGLTGDRIARLVCPIGIQGVSSKEPAAIAASVAADLLRRAEMMARAAASEDERAAMLANSPGVA
jgi:xanthine dehydrogenase accessory factor